MKPIEGNPLYQSVLELARAGYERRSKVTMPYVTTKLRKLGNYILNNSRLDHEFYLLPKALDGYKDGQLAIMFGCGIDSYCALHKALTDDKWSTKIHLVYVDYGQPYAWGERRVLDYVRKRYATEIESGFLEVHEHKIDLVPAGADLTWSSYIVPARNLVLAVIGTGYAGRVWIIANKRLDETVGTPDKTHRFYGETASICSEFYKRSIWIESPFIKLSKLEQVQDFLASGGSMEDLKNTFSCYGPQPTELRPGESLHCGECYACYKRFQLFQKLNEPFDFRKHPQDGPNWHMYEAQELAKRGTGR